MPTIDEAQLIECGKLAFALGFERDEFDVEEHHGPDEMAAWQRGWDEAKLAEEIQ